MKTKRALITILIVTLIIAVVLLSVKAYYVTVALVAGALIFGHRELWSLITKRKLPPFDERVKTNIDKSVRNGFIFFILMLALMMLPFSNAITKGPGIPYVLGGLLLSGGLVYLFSYLYYDRVEPRLNEKWSKLLRIFLIIAVISVAAGIISIFLHNAIYALLTLWFGEEFWVRVNIPDEPVFFVIAVIIAPLGFIVGFLGSIVVYIKGLFSKVGTD
jgi:hypothetical protein